MSSVRIVKVRDLNTDNLTTMEIPLEDFIEVVDSESDIVFKGKIRYNLEDAYFFIHDGIALYTQFVDVSSWTEFKNQYSKMNDGEFINYEDFSDAHQYGIDSNKIYQEFKKSEVYSNGKGRHRDPEQKKMIYAKYLDFSKSGFNALSEYDEASKFGAEDATEYYLFKSSEWSRTSDRYSYYRSDTQNDFIEFKDAMKKGFSSRKDYTRAIEMGFLTSKTYEMFVESKLDTKEEFDYMMNVFPSIVENDLVSIEQIKSEADAAFKEGRYQENVLKDYLYNEKLLNLAYTAMYKRKIEKEVMYDEILKDLKSKHGLEIKNVAEFTRYRRMRNSITHDNYKVSKQEASDAKKYLGELGVMLTQYIKTTVETQFK